MNNSRKRTIYDNVVKFSYRLKAIHKFYSDQISQPNFSRLIYCPSQFRVFDVFIIKLLNQAFYLFLEFFPQIFEDAAVRKTCLSPKNNLIGNYIFVNNIFYIK